MRIASPIQLVPEERQALHSYLTEPRTTHRLRLRALIILELDSGLSNLQIARKLGCSRRTTGIWRQRFLQQRLQSLLTRHSKAGRKPTLRNACCDCVVRHLTENQTAGRSVWSIRAIARACGVSKDTVHRIARQYGIDTSRRSNTANSVDTTQRAPDEIARGPADNADNSGCSSNVSCQPPAATTDYRPDQAHPDRPLPEQPPAPELLSSALQQTRE